MSAVAQISIQYAPFESFQSVPLNTDRYPVTPRVMAQYALYNRDLRATNYGINNNDHLTYTGGFITEESKINIKYSDFEVRTEENNLSQGGNLTVIGETATNCGIFNNNINLISQNNTIVNKIINVKSLDSLSDFIGSSFDQDVLTVKDFKRFTYYPGMIMLWSGSFEDLTSQMPYWRLCAPPHAGQTINGITVPNLLGNFIPGAVPQDRTSTNPQLYRTGDTGGIDAVNLNLNQIPTHHHSVTFSFNDPLPRFTKAGVDQPITGTLRYGYAGGGIEDNVKALGGGVCTQKNITCCCTVVRWRQDCGCSLGTSTIWGSFICLIRKYCDFCRETCNGVTSRPAAVTVTAGTATVMKNYTFKNFTFSNTEATITTQSEQNRGGTQPHENRPLFYTLAYIIYVGENN